ncbi:MAG: ABC transporter ATP-binding protein [Rhodothermales bacterium]|nr:ABC transporter ATP-binding protein [Rhodothermales bacterium]
MIELQGISKFYKQGLQKHYVLRNVDLTVREGEFVTVQGPSGSGKSTLLNILGMLEAPSEGEYFFEGVPVHRMSEKQRTELHREHIGFVFQAYHLIDELTVYENLETPLLYTKTPKKERQARVAEMLDRFGMVAKKDLFPHQLSGGQQQLVGVARALIIRPRLILADEPTGNLHSSQGEEVMEAFRALNADDGVTVVQVTHNETWAAYGSRVIELSDGWVEADREPAAAPA